MFLLRRTAPSTIKLVPNSLPCSTASECSSTAEKIEIPNRIQRSPTDILRALASTVGRDPTAAHYKYHDDPYLIPTSNISKRIFSLAQESGRKAARWIREEHRDLFQHSEAQPPIKAFAPKLLINEESEVNESTLQDLIMQSEVTDAILVYNLMKKKDMEIGAELRQGLLELVCFYNNEDPMPEELVEERWFTQSIAGRVSKRPSWKGELAEQIFSEIQPKTAASYASLIRGMAKYCQAERAFALLQEAGEQQLELDTNTFNAVIGVCSLLRDTPDQQWQLCQQLLDDMVHQELKPNIGTLNALLECIANFPNYKFSTGCALKVLSEFKNQLGIEPSLGTYYYILNIFCRNRGTVSHVIVDVLRELKGKEFTALDAKDTAFFVTAMEVCRNHLHDKTLAKELHSLLHTGNNYNLIGDTYTESIYYRHFLGLLCQTEPIDEFMQTYDRIVPNICIPEPGIMEEILKAVEANAAIELLPRLWSDIVVFEHTNRESLLMRMLKIMTENRPNIENAMHRNLPSQFAKIALDIYKKVAEQKEGRLKKLSFTGQMIGDILLLLVRGEDYEKAFEIFDSIDLNQHRIPGTPSDTCMDEFVTACITNKSPSVAIRCLQYCVENNMDSVALAKKINAGFTLNEVHFSKLTALVGNNFLKE